MNEQLTSFIEGDADPISSAAKPMISLSIGGEDQPYTDGAGNVVHTSLRFGRPGITSELVKITPDMAAELIAHRNASNYRKPRPQHIAKLTEAIAQGHWKVTGVPIIFDRSGCIIDGQHRLIACLRSGVPIVVMVTYGLDQEVAEAIDADQVSRSITDWLRRRNIGNAAHVASAVSYGLMLDLGMDPSQRLLAPIGQRIRWFLDNESGLVACQKAVARWNNHTKLIFPQSCAIGLGVHFMRRDRELAEQFWRAFGHASQCGPGDPPRVLYDAMSVRKSRPAPANKFDRYRDPALAIKAWNAYRDNRPLQRLTFKAVGQGAEAFPEIL